MIMSMNGATASFVFALLAVVFGIPTQMQAQSKPNPPPPKSKTIRLDEDFSAELPPIRPKSPTESLKSLEVQDGFRAELVAAEPLVRDPVAVAFDENGRMFVVELSQYNSYAAKNDNGLGTIRMLVDTDEDGRYDKSTVYLDNLDYPTAVACFDGGLFVGVAPDLLYVKDTDGDGKADLRNVVFTGFGRDKAGEGHINSLRWGLDNRFHLSTSGSGGEVRVASDPKARSISVRGRGGSSSTRAMRTSSS